MLPSIPNRFVTVDLAPVSFRIASAHSVRQLLAYSSMIGSTRLAKFLASDALHGHRASRKDSSYLSACKESCEKRVLSSRMRFPDIVDHTCDSRHITTRPTTGRLPRGSVVQVGFGTNSELYPGRRVMQFTLDVKPCTKRVEIGTGSRWRLSRWQSIMHATAQEVQGHAATSSQYSALQHQPPRLTLAPLPSALPSSQAGGEEAT